MAELRAVGDKTKIEWADATWTPVRAQGSDGRIGWHCEPVSEGCRGCYAEGINARLGTRLPYKPGHERQGDVRVFFDGRIGGQVQRWKRPRFVFVCSIVMR